MALVAQALPGLHPPVTAEVHVAGTYTLTIETWVNFIDVWLAPAGGSGGVGDGVPGNGGRVGTWLIGTFSRAAGDFPPGMAITILIGAGGAPVASSGNGNAGGLSRLSAASWSTYTAPGGLGGDTGNVNSTGQTPADQTVNGVVYHGGAGGILGLPGNAPGGGGGAGIDGSFSSGRGGDGGAQFVLRAA